MKALLGKLTLPGPLDDAARDAGLRELTVTAADARQLTDFPQLSRHDPVDRMILAQAARRDLDLLTSDRVLLGLGCDWITDARQ